MSITTTKSDYQITLGNGATAYFSTEEVNAIRQSIHSGGTYETSKQIEIDDVTHEVDFSFHGSNYATNSNFGSGSIPIKIRGIPPVS